VALKALGTVTPLNTVIVRSRLDGELVRVHFTEGQRAAAACTPLESRSGL
jgi:multidrug efflux system membrane fusion protein